MEWATCGPIIAAVLRDLLDDYLDEDENCFEKRFRSDHVKLKDVFREVGNPFEEQPLINLVVKIVVPPDSVESIRTAYAIGER